MNRLENKNPPTLNDITDTCLSALKEGMNRFSTSSDRRIIIHELFIEMEIKPANC